MDDAVQLDLTPHEAGLLHSILVSYLGDLRMEIAATDLLDFRNRLKEREDFIKRVLAQLPGE